MLIMMVRSESSSKHRYYILPRVTHYAKSYTDYQIPCPRVLILGPFRKARSYWHTYQFSPPRQRGSRLQKREVAAEKGGQKCSSQSCTTLLLRLPPNSRLAGVEPTHKHQNWLQKCPFSIFTGCFWHNSTSKYSAYARSWTEVRAWWYGDRNAYHQLLVNLVPV